LKFDLHVYGQLLTRNPLKLVKALDVALI